LRKADLTTEDTEVFTEVSEKSFVTSVKTFVPSVVKSVFRPKALLKW
jgi:hypothetical protein